MHRFNLDKLIYASHLDSLNDLKDDPEYCFVKGDTSIARCSIIGLSSIDLIQ